MKKIVSNFDEVKAFLGAAGFVVSLVPFFSSENVERAQVIGVALACSAENSIYIPCNHLVGENLNIEKPVLEILEQIRNKFILLWDSKNQIRILEKASATPLECFNRWDVQIDYWNMDTNVKSPLLHDIQTLLFGVERSSFDSFVNGGGCFQYLKPEDVAFDLCFDAESLFSIEQYAEKWLKDNNVNTSLEQNAIYPIMKLEDSSVRIDKDAIEAVDLQAKEDIKEHLRNIFDLTGERYNYESEISTRKILRKLGIKSLAQGDISLSSLGKVLEDKTIGKVSKEVVSNMISLRKILNYQNNTLSGIKKVAEQGGGRGRFCYHVCQVPTGRLSSGKTSNDYFSNMNIQSVVKPEKVEWFARRASEKELRAGEDVLGWCFSRMKECDSEFIVEGCSHERNIRQCFLPEENSLWVTIDMDSQELRIISNVYNEQKWIDAFLAGKDIHKENAVRMFGAENYSQEIRKAVKAYTYGLNYGMSDFSFLENNKFLTKEKAASFVETFKKSIPHILDGQKKDFEEARRLGYCKAGFSRKRKISDFLKAGEGAYAERISKNTPIQGYAGDILRFQLIKLWSHVFSIEMGVKPMMTIHDEINFSISRNNFNKLLQSVLMCMSVKIPCWPVPLTCGIEIGKSWGGTFKFCFDEKNGKFVPIVKRRINVWQQ